MKGRSRIRKRRTKFIPLFSRVSQTFNREFSGDQTLLALTEQGAQ